MTHVYRTRVKWTGTTGVGYDSYSRDHVAQVLDAAGQPIEPAVESAALRLSADPAFRGDADLINSEQLLVLAASACQLLSFLAVAARARIDVTEYTDEAVGEMPHDWIRSIELSPVVTVRGSIDDERLRHWVDVAHTQCYIARSLRTEVRVYPSFCQVG